MVPTPAPPTPSIVPPSLPRPRRITTSTSRETRSNVLPPPPIAKSVSGQTARSSGSGKRERSPDPVVTAPRTVKRSKSKRLDAPETILTDEQLEALSDDAFQEYQSQFRPEHPQRPFTPDSGNELYYRFAPGQPEARFPEIAEWAIRNLDQAVEYRGSHRVSRSSS